MKKYLTLYLKELKSISGIAVFLFVSMVVAYLYDFFAQNILDIHYPHNYYGYKFVRASVFMLPVLLAYTLNIERKSGTHFLALSLSVPRYTIMLCKFLAVISIGALLVLLIKFQSEVIRYSIIFPLQRWINLKTDTELLQFFKDRNLYQSINPYLSFPYRIILERFFGTDVGTDGIFCLFDKYFWIGFLRAISPIIIYCSMVCLAQGVMATVKRNRALVWIAVFVTSLFIFSVFYERITGVPINNWANYRYSESTTYFSILAGLILLFIGHFLYEKYAEV